MEKVLVIFPLPKGEVVSALGNAGFEPIVALNSKEGIRDVYQFHPDAVIMADSLPPVDGLQLHTRLREITRIPIIVLGEKGDIARAATVEEGADLYLDARTGPRELVARLYSLLHRYHRHGAEPRFDPRKGTVKMEDKVTELTPTEFRLLSCLALNRGKVVTYARLIAEVWDRATSLEIVRLYVRRLKEKLGLEDSAGPYRLTNLRGEGYCFQEYTTNIR